MNRRIHTRARAYGGRAAVLAAALCAAALPAAGQLIPQLPVTPRDTVPAPLSPLPVRVSGQSPGSVSDEALLAPAHAPLLDAPVSRTEYVLGAADRLQVSVFGDFNHLFDVAVSPEGSVVLPGIGITRVLGLNLDEAEQRVRELVGRYYRNVNVRLTLSQVRTFKVFVVGDVAQPGVRQATAATRVSEVLGALASDATAHRRNITLRRASGQTIPVDLVRFIQAGDVSANPTLREGDAVIVPTLDEKVDVFGRVHYPAAYEFRPGESLTDLLTVANGGGDFPADAADTVRVVRFLDAQQRTTILFSRDEAMGARGHGFVMRPFDAVYVAAYANWKQQRYATVEGQVARPGTYPIRPDTTTVRELVEMAGGFTQFASVIDATLRREAPVRGRDELANVPPQLLNQQDRRIYQVRSVADQGKVVVDFQQLFVAGTPAYEQTLRSGDVLIVPVRRDEVSVLGAVRTPGLVAYRTGRSVGDFVAAAGGYSRRADRGHLVVVKARTGARLSLREAGRIEPGDAVIVPFKEDKPLLTFFQYAQAIAGTISIAVLAGVALFRKSGVQ